MRKTTRKKYFSLFLFVIILTPLYAAATSITKTTPAKAKHAMVVTSHHLATQVGLNILKEGGNAIDAAVAVGYALAVVEPCCGNIGGGGFMIIHLAKNSKNRFINFRERAPLAIKQAHYQKDAKQNRTPNKIKNKIKNKNSESDPHKIRHGYLAAGVPGTVMGLNFALKKQGTMTLKRVIAPAIKLAKNGFILRIGDIKSLKSHTKMFLSQPNVAAIFLNHDKPYQIGDRLIQRNLAQILQLISEKGTAAFYQGSIAKTLVKESRKYGGVFSMKDFRNYSVQELKPITCEYRGYKIISAPPPSSGGVTLCQMLSILTPYPLHEFGFHSAKAIHYSVEAMRYAYADRNHYLGDPDFVTMPIKKLLSSQYIDSIRNRINPMHAGDSSKVGFKFPHYTGEKPQTTSYAIIDKFGNAVEVTYTINGRFGAGVIAGNTGFFLNNEMDDFTLQSHIPNQFGLVQGKANAIQPGKRPLSSMTPTLIIKKQIIKNKKYQNRRFLMVIGAAGGSTIITQVLAAIQNVIDYHMNIQTAIDAPRIHMQWLPDAIFMEPLALSKKTQHTLKKMGYNLKLGSPYQTKYWGSSVAILQVNGVLYGTADSRRSTGLALGY